MRRNDYVDGCVAAASNGKICDVFAGRLKATICPSLGECRCTKIDYIAGAKSRARCP